MIGADFGQALDALKSNRRVRRADWPEGRYLSFQPGRTAESVIPPEELKPPREHEWAPVHVATLIVDVQVGRVQGWSEAWAPRHADLLAEDWEIL